MREETRGELRLKVVPEEHALLRNGGRARKRFVEIEPVEHRRTVALDHASVPLVERPAEHNDRAGEVAAFDLAVQNHRDLGGAGRDHQIFFPEDRLGERLGRRALVDHDRVAVREQACRKRADRPLLVREAEFAFLEVEFVPYGREQDDAAVDAADRFLLREQREIAADRFGRHVEGLRKIGDRRPSVALPRA